MDSKGEVVDAGRRGVGSGDGLAGGFGGDGVWGGGAVGGVGVEGVKKYLTFLVMSIPQEA